MIYINTSSKVLGGSAAAYIIIEFARLGLNHIRSSVLHVLHKSGDEYAADLKVRYFLGENVSITLVCCEERPYIILIVAQTAECLTIIRLQRKI